MTTPSTPPFSVSGKTALITGAGSGINLAFAQLLLSKNCNVLIADLSLRPEAQTLLESYPTSPKCLFIRTDVTKWPDLTNMFTFATANFPSLDIVCPGAGVFEPHWSNFWRPPGTPPSTDSPAGSQTEGVGHYATLDINITHPIRVTQMAISLWLNHPDRVSPSNPKRIVHISSIAGQLPGLACPMYAASKHAISGFVRSLAGLEEKLGVRVNAVAPGIIRTPLWTEHPEKMGMVDESTNVWVEAEEVAEGMLACVERGDVGGGYVMEILKGRTRNVEAWGAARPEGPGSNPGNAAGFQEEVWVELGREGWGVIRG